MESSSQSSFELLNSLEFCVFDLETTGGNQEQDQIIEIGLVKIKNLQITEELSYLIKPDIKVPEFIQRLTSITNKDLENAPTIESVIEELVQFMGSAILVAHNSSFDIPFFNSVLSRLNRPLLQNKVLCTNMMTKYLIPNLMNSNLNYMSQIFKISHVKAHRALDDAKAAAELLLKYLAIFEKKKISKINHLYYPVNKFELDRLTIKRGGVDSSHKLLMRLKEMKMPYMFTLKGENGILLFSLPCAGLSAELRYLEEQITTLKWEQATIRLVGPFIETVINYGRIFEKLDETVRNNIISFLHEVHLSELEKKRSLSELSTTEITSLLGDFIILNHLVPEQYLLYPTLTLDTKTRLIFRYPGHKKKLVQFILSKINILKTAKLKHSTTPLILKEFLYNYLQTEQGSQEVLKVSASTSNLAQPEKFYREVEGYIRKNPNLYNYPCEHL